MIESLYFLWGSEPYLIDEEIKNLIRSLGEENGEEPELVFLEADYLEPGQLLEALDFSSLFNMKRVVVIKRPLWLTKSRKKRSKTDDYLRALEAYVEHPSQNQLLIITLEENPSAFGLGKKSGQGVRSRQLKKPESAGLAQWVQIQFNQRGREINPRLSEIIAGSGQNMYYIVNLIEKLCLMNPGLPVQPSEIESELSSQEEIKVFKLSDALLRRELGPAIKAYHQLLSQGESEGLFLYIIVRQFIQMAKVKSLAQEGKSNKDIEALTGMKTWMIKNKREQANRFSWDQIKQLFKFFLEADTRMKRSSQDNQLVMEELMVKICTI